PVESRYSQFKMMKGQRDQQTAIATAKREHADRNINLAKAEENKQAEVTKLMKEYNTLFKEGKYAEAETKAMLAHELDPDNPMTESGRIVAHMARNRGDAEKNKSGKEEFALQGLNDTDKLGPFTDTVKFGEDYRDRTKNRKSLDILLTKPKSKEEQQIERSLESPQTLHFKDAPLSKVIEDLRVYTGMNIDVDEHALAEEGVGLDRPLTMQLDQVKLKSALKLLLGKVNLTYVVEDDVLKITSVAHAKGKVTKV